MKAPSTEDEELAYVYALRHAIFHLFEAQAWQHLFAALDSDAFGQAKLQWDPSALSYVADLDIGRRAISLDPHVDDPNINIPRLWRYTLLRSGLISRATSYPPKVFGILAALGRTEEAARLADLLTEPQESAAALGQIVQELRAHDPERPEIRSLLLRAYKLLEEQAEPEVLERLIEVTDLSDPELAGQARAAADRQEDPTRHCVLLGALAQTYHALGQPEHASRLLREVEHSVSVAQDPGTRVEILIDLARRLQAAQQQPRATEALRVAGDAAVAIDDASERMSALTSLASAAAASGIWDIAEQAIAGLRDEDDFARAMAVPDILSAYVKANLPERAEGLAGRMPESWSQARAYAALAKAYAEREPVDQKGVKRLLGRAAHAASSIRSPIMGDIARADALYALVDAYLAADMVDRAEATAASMPRSKSFGDYARAKGAIARWYAQSGRMKRAEEIAGSIEFATYRAATFADLAQLYLQKGEVERAARMLDWVEAAMASVEAPSPRARALAAFAQSVARTDQRLAKQILVLAEGAAQEVEENDDRVEVLAELAESYTLVGMIEDALRIVEQGATIAAYLPDDIVETRAGAQATLVRVCVKAEQWERAKQIADKVTDSSMARAATQAVLVEAYARSRQWHRAERILVVPSTLPSQLAYLARVLPTLVVVHLFRAVGLRKRAKRMVARLSVDGNDLGFLEPRIVLARSYAAAGLWDRAERAAEAIPAPFSRHRARALVAVAQVAAAAHDWDRAQRAANLIEARPTPLAELANSIIEAGYERSFLTSVGLTSDVVMPLEIRGYLAVARAYASGNDQSLMVKGLREAEQLAAGVDESDARVELIVVVMEAYTTLGRWQDVERVALSEAPTAREAKLSGLKDLTKWDGLTKNVTKMEKVAPGPQSLEERQGSSKSNIDYQELPQSVLPLLAQAYTAAQQWAPALEATAAISDSEDQSKACAALVDSALASEQWRWVERAIEKISDDRQRVQVQAALVSASTAAGRPDIGLDLVQAALLGANTLEEAWTQVRLPTGLVPYYSQLGRAFLDAVEHVQRALEAIRGNSNTSSGTSLVVLPRRLETS